MIPFLLFKIFFQSWKQTSASQCGEVEHVIGLWDAAGGLLLPWTAQNSQRVCVSPQGIAAAYKHSLTLNLSDPCDRWIKEILQRGLHLIAIITIDCNNAGIVFYETQLNLCSKNCIRSEILRAGFLCKSRCRNLGWWWTDAKKRGIISPTGGSWVQQAQVWGGSQAPSRLSPCPTQPRVSGLEVGGQE